MLRFIKEIDDLDLCSIDEMYKYKSQTKIYNIQLNAQISGPHIYTTNYTAMRKPN